MSARPERRRAERAQAKQQQYIASGFRARIWPPEPDLGRSKYYWPHIGTKERGRYAGRPDGPMHVTGHQRRAEWQAWRDSLPSSSTGASRKNNRSEERTDER